MAKFDDIVRKAMRDDEIPLSETHEEKFMYKLKSKFKEYMSILPHLIKVAIVTIIVFVASIIIWNNYIRKDRHEVTLKEKIVNIFTKL